MVQKEMFTFTDKGEREMALRPEGTPGAVRAYIEHNLYKLAQPIKLFYIGPMFRQERQQRGRYRQHTQIGVEALGTSDPLVDVEVISLLYAIHRAVGVRDEIVYLNNLGDAETRQTYVPELRAYLKKHSGELDPDSLARMETNPLRTFDSKHEGTQAVLAEAPRITSFLSEEASAHLAAVLEGLGALGIPYEIDDGLVRGLDYYTMTVFEAKSGALGAQDTVGAGGRYNGLISDLGGPDLGGIGFGSGVERMLLAAASQEKRASLDVFFVTLAPEARIAGHDGWPGHCGRKVSPPISTTGGGACGRSSSRPTAPGASYAVVLGEDELAARRGHAAGHGFGRGTGGARGRRGEGPASGRLGLSDGPDPGTLVVVRAGEGVELSLLGERPIVCIQAVLPTVQPLDKVEGYQYPNVKTFGHSQGVRGERGSDVWGVGRCEAGPFQSGTSLPSGGAGARAGDRRRTVAAR